MRLSKEPILTITKAWLADSVRAVKSRVPGAFESLRNLVPNLSDGIGRLRTGYSAYDSSNQGLDPPTGMQITKIVPIQSPAQDDVHIYFCSNSGQKVYVNPWYMGSSKQTTNLLINETVPVFNPTDADVTVTPDHTLTIANSISYGLTRTTGYYNGWSFYNSTKNKYCFVKTSVWDGLGDTTTFTFVESIAGAAFNFAVSDSFALYRNFQDNNSFAPAYNTDLANAPCVNSENSFIRFSGGQGSAAGNRGIYYAPRLTRTYFPDLSDKFTFDGSYVSERELKALNETVVLSFAWEESDTRAIGASSVLESDKTLWFAVAPVYDNFQIGPLQKYETVASYPTDSGTYWSTVNNYISSSYTTLSPRGFNLYGLQIGIGVPVGRLNRRITGLNVYLAVDPGQTTTRHSPYYFIKHLSFVQTNNSVVWTFTSNPTLQTFDYVLNIEQTDILAKGSPYSIDSGVSESAPDTMYSYSTEEIIGGRRLLANAYVTSESFTDRQTVFTNAVGGNATIGNSGSVQLDLFPNQEQVYRLKIQPTTGTQINALVPTGIQEFLVLKDRGVGLCRISILANGLPELDMRTESVDVGCSTLNAWRKDDNDVIYFPSYQDIYAYRSGQLAPLIERQDKNDWLDTYRNTVSSTDKQNAVVIYLPELKAMMFLFGNQKSTSTGYNGMQYILFPADGRWAEVRLKEATAKATCSFKYVSSLQNGHVICTTTDSTAVNKRLTWKYNGTQYVFYFSDDGTSINYYLKQGALSVGGSEAMDAILDKIVLNRTLTSTTTGGTLDCGVIKDGGTTRTFGGLTKTLTRIPLKFTPTDAKVGARWDLIVNSNASPEVTSSGDTIQIDSIEYHGKVRPRILRTTE